MTAPRWVPFGDGLQVKVDLANGPSRVAVTVFDGKLYACAAVNPRNLTRAGWVAAIGDAAARCVEELRRPPPRMRLGWRVRLPDGTVDVVVQIHFGAETAQVAGQSGVDHPWASLTRVE